MTRNSASPRSGPRLAPSAAQAAEPSPFSLLPSPFASEAELVARWAGGLRGALRLEDGRSLRVVFPGVPGGASGPDFRGAILDAGGDLLRGDVELHLLASGWRAHGHHADAAYAGVVLHVLALNDGGNVSTAHVSGRAIPILVVRAAGQSQFPPPFTPPCALHSARGRDPAPALERLGLRRLRMKAARVAPLVASAGAGQALYQLLLETLAGPANRAAFAAIARQLPLAALLERSGRPFEGPVGPPRAALIGAELRGAAAGQVLRRAGLRPLAAPGRRLDAAAALFARLWPEGASPGWPAALAGGSLAGPLPAPGVGRAALIECRVNAVLPVALAAGVAPEAAVEAAFLGLPSPATYGRLRRLESWLAAGAKPFSGAATLQGGLLLHADYCTKGMCGRCPLS